MPRLMLRCCFCLLLSLALHGQHPWVQKPSPVAATEFPILAWNPSPSDPESLSLMKEAGLNVSGFCRIEDLDKVRSAGLSCVVSYEPLRELISRGHATDDKIRKTVAELKARIDSHPAVFGINLRDEPSASAMPLIGRIAAELRRSMPEKLPYINLFPNYASSQSLGTESYDAYLHAYLDDIRLPYLSWDNYSLLGGEMDPRFYDNLEQVRKVTLEAGIPFWNCILANAHFHYSEPSDATFNLQVYATLAYGGRGIQFFTYFTPRTGNYRLAPIDIFGNKTATWDMLRRITWQIHALAPALSKLKSTGVYHWPVSTAAGTPLVEDLRSSGRFLVGEFADSSGRNWLMLVNKDLKESASFRVKLRNPEAQLVRISPSSGEEGPLGPEGGWLAPGSGILMRIEAP
ncbi:MAG: hypothetical protein LC114_21430 [Bryobacterales bacterium]|nr:hypothetical protein [Bryobacterales bacterium]